MNGAAINYHFGSKDGLFEWLMTEFADKTTDNLKMSFAPPKTTEDFRVRLTLFTEAFIRQMVDDPERLRFVHLHIDRFAKAHQKAFKDSILTFHFAFNEFLQSAQKLGIIRSELNIQVVQHIFISSLIDLARNTFISENYFGYSVKEEAFRKTFVNNLIDIFFVGVGTHE